MILRPMGAPLGMMTMALAAKWAFLLGVGLGAALGAAAMAALNFRRGRDTHGSHHHDAAMADDPATEPGP